MRKPAADPIPLAGETGAIIRAKDWSTTPLGPMESWPQSLKTALSICLGSRQPMFVWWKTGEKLTIFYNDAYIPIAGAKHPDQIGVDPRSPKGWAEMWPYLEALVEQVFREGTATWNENLMLPLYRREDFLEEGYFSFSYSPIIDETGQVGGMYCATSETTKQVLGERRLRLLRNLGTGMALQSAADVAMQASQQLAENPHDLPFSLLYLVADGQTASLAGHSLIAPGTAASPLTLPLDSVDDGSVWPLADVYRHGQQVLVRGLRERFPAILPTAPWDRAPDEAVILPIKSPGQASPLGFLVVGLSTRLHWREDYESFLKLVAGHIATNFTNAGLVEAERKRAEELAALDRAKTTFFNNVSHEFRTPLTLLLGPTEDALQDEAHPLPAPQRERLDTVHRNAQRLLRLVNTLLDFSRIEQGRIQGLYRATDVCALTVDLASAFRSLMERAGLTLSVECAPQLEPVYVDREMYEKVVLNLLSNAFKFTFQGGVRVLLQTLDGHVHLVVADTGTGIPEDELPHVFKRFHRVEHARGRSYEGSGIGLALVQELVKLHAGSITVTSRVGEGSTFTVTLPLGTAHLPPEHIAASVAPTSFGTGAASFVNEAAQWIQETPAIESCPRGETVSVPHGAPRHIPGHILLADDNADMRAYLQRLLSDQGWSVEATGDGETALQRARARRPDLVLSDVMMPGVDGIGLLRGLKHDARTRDVPVILLSARAGEESRIGGLEAGADDYLMKPFSARELVARVHSQLALAEVRTSLRASEARQTFMLKISDALRPLADPIAIQATATRLLAEQLDADRSLYTRVDVDRGLVWVEREFVRGDLPSLLGEYRLATFSAAYQAYRAQRPLILDDTEDERVVPASDIPNYRALAIRAAVAVPIIKDGVVVANMSALKTTPYHWTPEDVSCVEEVGERAWSAVERARAEAALHQSEDRFRLFISATSDVVYRMSADWRQMHYLDGKAFMASTGSTREEWTDEYIPVEERPSVWSAISRAIEHKSNFELEHRVTRVDGSTGWVFSRAVPVLNARGELVEWFGMASDITERKRTEEALLETDRRKDEFLAMLAHELRNPLAPIRTGLELIRLAGDTPSSVARVRGVLERQIGHMVRLIDDLLDVSRINSSKIHLQRRPTALAELVEAAVEANRAAIEAGQKELAVSIPRTVCTLDVDPTRFVQVLSNLLHNATKFTPPGGHIQLRADVRPSSDTDMRARLELTVSDDGIGISPEMLPRIFELFIQGKDAGQQSSPGLGIGLALARRLTDMHGGSLEARSDGPGRGSAFTIHLSCADTPAADHSRPNGSVGRVMRRVLIIDDNVDAADTLAMLIRDLGGEAHIAPDGTTGVLRARALRPDVIFLDIGMPGIDGYETCRRIRAESQGAPILIVALTGWGQEHDKEQALNAGVDAHLTKPADPAALARLLIDVG